MKDSTGFDIPSYEDIFVPQDAEEGVQEIPLELLDSFPNHPFFVADDHEMGELVKSIKEVGVLTPATVRKKSGGRYEIISGHRRKRACEIAGLQTLKCEVISIADNDAVIAMVDSNTYRKALLPSEKAFAYKMYLEAMSKKRGRPSEEDADTDGKRTSEILGEKLGESREQVRRYIRLTKLIKELLDMADTGKLKFTCAVELSYLDENSQKMIAKAIGDCGKYPSLKGARELREMYEDKAITESGIINILCPSKVKSDSGVFVLKSAKIMNILPPSLAKTEIENYLCEAIKCFAKHGGDKV